MQTKVGFQFSSRLSPRLKLCNSIDRLSSFAVIMISAKITNKTLKLAGSEFFLPAILLAQSSSQSHNGTESPFWFLVGEKKNNQASTGSNLCSAGSQSFGIRHPPKGVRSPAALGCLKPYEVGPSR